MIDCHIHLEQYDPLPALPPGTQVVAVGVDPASNRRTLDLARRLPGQVWPALGYHPEHEHPPGALAAVLRQLRRHRRRIVAVGEVGLPEYNLRQLPPEQREAHLQAAQADLAALCRAAVDLDLPVCLHAVHAGAARALAVLQATGVRRAMFHWLKAPPAVVEDIVGAGYCVSVTPEVCFRERDRELVRQVPPQRLLLETDGPWQHAGPFAARPTAPDLLADSAAAVGRIWGALAAEVLAQTAANARRLFRLP